MIMTRQREDALARASATPPEPVAVELPEDDGDPEFAPEAPDAITLAGPPPIRHDLEVAIGRGIRSSEVTAPSAPTPTIPVTIVHPLADFTVHALDVILSPQMITLLLPKAVGARFAPKQSTEFEMMVRGVRHRVMACSDAADSTIFPCSIIAFLRLKMDDKE
jgi:hypothetical protein